MDVNVHVHVDVNMYMNIKSKWRRLDAYSALIACRSFCCAIQSVDYDSRYMMQYMYTAYNGSILHSTIPYHTIPYHTIPYHTTPSYYTVL